MSEKLKFILGCIVTLLLLVGVAMFATHNNIPLSTFGTFGRFSHFQIESNIDESRRHNIIRYNPQNENVFEFEYDWDYYMVIAVRIENETISFEIEQTVTDYRQIEIISIPISYSIENRLIYTRTRTPRGARDTRGVTTTYFLDVQNILFFCSTVLWRN